MGDIYNNNNDYKQQPYDNGYGQQPPYGQQPGYIPNGYCQPPFMVKPDSNLVWAILSTILCCLPFGIVSIVYASKVDSLWAMGDYNGAKDASNKARKWALVSAVSAFVFSLLYVLFWIFLAGLAVL